MRAMRTDADQVAAPRLSGRVALVTGASSGIGLVTARRLAGFGARTLLGCRDPRRADLARELILRRHPDAVVECVPLDLASLESVEEAAADIADRTGALDLLVNNAGVMAPPRSTATAATADGFEMQFGTNHLGHFALTGRLLPQLLAADAARVITVSSLAHRAAIGVALADPLAFRTLPHGSVWLGYARSKLANLLFAFELHRRSGAEPPVGDGAGGVVGDPDQTGARRLLSIAAHPGFASTELVAKSGASRHRISGPAILLATRLSAQSAESAALPTLYAATSNRALSGRYYGPRYGTRGTPAEITPSRLARDQRLAALLWAASTEATGVGYEELLMTSGPWPTADR